MFNCVFDQLFDRVPTQTGIGINCHIGDFDARFSLSSGVGHISNDVIGYILKQCSRLVPFRALHESLESTSLGTELVELVSIVDDVSILGLFGVGFDHVKPVAQIVSKDSIENLESLPADFSVSHIKQRNGVTEEFVVIVSKLSNTGVESSLSARRLTSDCLALRERFHVKLRDLTDIHARIYSPELIFGYRICASDPFVVINNEYRFVHSAYRRTLPECPGSGAIREKRVSEHTEPDYDSYRTQSRLSKKVINQRRRRSGRLKDQQRNGNRRNGEQSVSPCKSVVTA
ncbi:hypothetical protein [Halorubrum sp. SP9]|uniref:hypothetical protein n=1 Tax=Halorubrum sp. SP9 TaxID=1537267 RepID=UPI001F546B2A|nr:hypothetical protein [Halorubrum sp. SP9]